MKDFEEDLSKQYKGNISDQYLHDIVEAIKSIKDDINTLTKEINELKILICPKDMDKGIVNIVNRLRLQMKLNWGIISVMCSLILKDWIAKVIK